MAGRGNFSFGTTTTAFPLAIAAKTRETNPSKENSFGHEIPMTPTGSLQLKTVPYNYKIQKIGLKTRF